MIAPLYSNLPFVSVIIPVYNGEKTILACLESVFSNNYPCFEVIVCNDCSTDRTLEFLNLIKDPRLKLINFSINSKTMGSAARNAGIVLAKGDIILLLDSDTIVKSDWINLHINTYKKNNKIQVVGGGVKGIHKTISGQADDYCSWWTSIPYSRSRYIKKLHLPTNNLSLRKEVFEKLGLFDETLKGGEDAEFFSRIIKQKIPCYFNSRIIIKHKDRDSLKSYLKHQYVFGLHAVNMRKRNKMDYSFLMPRSYFLSWFYILPLAKLYTLFTILKWLPYKPQIVFYIHLVFLGKLAQAIAIKDSLKTKLESNLC
ncbi:glycosyltransferase [Candidatus Woesearchaeota archaeon]|nr:glycosyltransferase [Candidatus Woesearchaeota archaeon]